MVVREHEWQLSAYAVRRGSANTAVAPAIAEMLDNSRQGSSEATGLKSKTMWRLPFREFAVAGQFNAGVRCVSALRRSSWSRSFAAKRGSSSEAKRVVQGCLQVNP